MAEATFRQGQNGYSGTSDTIIRQSRPGNVYGDNADLDVDLADKAGGAIQTLLAFDDIFGDAPGQVPLGARITSATLTLSVTNSTRDGFSLYRMVDDWTTAPDWSWNGFGDGIQTDGTEAVSSPAHSYSELMKGTQTLDITSSVQDWADGVENHGWLFKANGADGFRFSSSEGASAPILNITYEIVTPPGPGLVVAETGGSTFVTEGGAGDEIRVSLAAAPTSNVTVTLSTSSSGDLALSSTSLTFTASNWQTAQTVALAAIDDSEVEGLETATVTLTTSSGDARYAGLGASVDVSIADDDAPPPPPPPPGPVTLSPSVVAVHDGTQWSAGDSSGAGVSDPSGIAYIPHLDAFFIVDSEHNESPFYSQTNLFVVDRSGTQIGSHSLRGFTDEPTGIAYDPQSGRLYITDDDDDRIYIVDVNDPETKVGEIDVERFGFEDAEDPIVDPTTGNLIMLDGIQRLMVELTPDGDLVGQTLLGPEIAEAEGLAYDATQDVFYVSSGANRGAIFQIDRDGEVLQTFDVNDFRNPISSTKPRLKGLELAPSSDPNDGDKVSLYAVDYGLDQYADGRVFEIDLYSDWVGA